MRPGLHISDINSADRENLGLASHKYPHETLTVFIPWTEMKSDMKVFFKFPKPKSKMRAGVMVSRGLYLSVCLCEALQEWKKRRARTQYHWLVNILSRKPNAKLNWFCQLALWIALYDFVIKTLANRLSGQTDTNKPQGVFFRLGEGYISWVWGHLKDTAVSRGPAVKHSQRKTKVCNVKKGNSEAVTDLMWLSHGCHWRRHAYSPGLPEG